MSWRSDNKFLKNFYNFQSKKYDMRQVYKHLYKKKKLGWNLDKGE